MIKTYLQVISIFLYLQNLFAQSNEWPAFFIAPDSTLEQVDSTHLNISNEFSLYEQLRGKFLLEYVQSQNNVLFKQLYEHTYMRYSDQTNNQYLDLSGSVLWQQLPISNSELGFTYEPQVNYNKRPSGSIIRGNINTGPFIKTKLFQIPIKVAAGITGITNEELPGGLSSMALKYYNGDAGVYGGCEIGDTLRGIGGKPVFIDFRFFGKTIKGVGSGLVMGKMLFQHEFRSGDSLFIYGADSLLNGKDIVFSYQTTPWSINHSLQGSTGLKARERVLGIIPAAIYSYKLNTIEYPSSDQLVDIKNSSHTINFQVTTTNRYFFDYLGGLQLTWDYEDHYFREKSEKNTFRNTNDHHSDLASSDHLLMLNFPKNIAAVYEFHAFKDAKKYVTLNENEKDHIRTRHHWGLKIDSLAGTCTEIYSEYAKTYLYYFRAMNSQLSKIIEDYRIGLNLSIVKGRLRLEEKIAFDAEISEFKFKNSKNLPPYNRRVSSILNGNWALNNNIEFTGTWIQKYNDNGYWYGREYLDSSEIPVNSYYAIDSKTGDYALLFFSKLLYENWAMNAGAAFRNINQRKYDHKSGTYLKDYRKGYTIEPSVKFSFLIGFLQTEGKIGRMFDSKDEDRRDAGKNWDLLLKLSATF